ncbi:DUF4913 domain-containing protein [Rhodococcus sp. UNC23MFCrub1.1]|uniref:DUF4913 domain-containing protein n=1 Tax=Rhodococcus sp. UNC23MFCrub1.1 TaxID=1449068 RepID=UPI000A7F44E7|nr:DUF4913 domain-containing protein [Rhodococcus sp. UNC23MFCrub1.1]
MDDHRWSDPDRADPDTDGVDPDRALDITEQWDDAAESPEDGPERRYPDLEAFVDGFFAQVVNRHLSDRPGDGATWDPRWWRHREVRERLRALWDAYEGALVASAEDASALSRWWLTDLDGHLKVLLDGRGGPMSHTDPDGSWTGHPPLRTVPVPDGFDLDDA